MPRDACATRHTHSKDVLNWKVNGMIGKQFPSEARCRGSQLTESCPARLMC